MSMVDILIPIRFDSPERRRNFNIVEGMYKSWGYSVISYEDTGAGSFYRTKYFNEMLEKSTADVCVLADADVIYKQSAIEPAIYDCLHGAVMCYPSNGIVINIGVNDSGDVGNLLAALQISSQFGGRDGRAYGGVVVVNRNKFMSMGGENEYCCGWGGEDFERYYRIKTLSGEPKWGDTVMFHLAHPRVEPQHNAEHNTQEADKVRAMDYDTLLAYMKSWPWRVRWKEKGII